MYQHYTLQQGQQQRKIRALVTVNIAIEYEVPISHFSDSRDGLIDESETALGNTYIGLKINNPENTGNKFIGHFGIRLPLAPDDASDALVIGAYSNFGRYEAFLPHYFIVSTSGTYQVATSETMSFRFSLGGDVLLATEDNRDTELFINYNMYLSKELETVIFNAGFNGKLLASANGDFGDKSVHQIAVSGFYKGERFKPGFSIKVPVDDDINELVDIIFGFKLIYSLN